MQTTEKITGTQLGLLLFTFMGSTIVLTIPGWMVMIAKQNGWISVIPSTTTGLLTLQALITLAKRYPGLTIIQYSSKIIGKWLGKCLGFFYIYVQFNAISVMTIQHTFSDLIKPFLEEGIQPVLQGAVIPGGAFMNQVFIYVVNLIVKAYENHFFNQLQPGNKVNSTINFIATEQGSIIGTYNGTYFKSGDVILYYFDSIHC